MSTKMKDGKKVVLTYGTFDMLHYGHIRILKRAKALGDYLIVGLSNDAFVREKNKQCYFTYEFRKEMLEAIKYVDLVIEESDWNQKIPNVLQYQVDVFTIGDDWAGEFDYLKEYCEAVYLPRTVGISTSQMKDDFNLQELKKGE